MNKKIESHVDELFDGVANKIRVLEIKEELLANLNDKYNDLIANGKNEDEAYSLVISSIGDINELLNDYKYLGENNNIEIEKKRNIKSVFVSIGVSLYILSLAILFIFERFALEDIGIVCMILICAIATGLLVYGVSLGKTKYKKTNDTFVENYKEKVSEDDRIANMKKAIISSLWSLIVVVYLATSFITGLWQYTWLIFILGVFLQQLAIFILCGRNREGFRLHSLYWSATILIYFILGFAFSAWAWSWMIFLLAFAVGQLTKLVTLWRKSA